MKKKICFCYTCSFDNFNNEKCKDGTPMYDWENAWWRLLNVKNTYGKKSTGIITLEMRQGCRNKDGFYPNFVYLLVEKTSNWDFG